MVRTAWRWQCALHFVALASLSACADSSAPTDAAIGLDARVPDPVDAATDSAREPTLDARMEASDDADASDAAGLEDAQATSDAAADAGDASDEFLCACAQPGSWQLANISPCFWHDGDQIFMYSSRILESGRLDCGTATIGEPPTPPAPTWSSSSIELSCAGDFEVCWEIRAGVAEDPKPSDCVVVRVCTRFEYSQAGERIALPDLPAWVASDPACVESFDAEGGYGLATLQGALDACGGSTPEPAVFAVRNYCSPRCHAMPTAQGCNDCGLGLH
jgi:hypothetical protein